MIPKARKYLSDDDRAEIGEFWSPEDDEQLALEEREWESKKISKAVKSDAVGVGVKAKKKRYSRVCSGRIKRIGERYCE